jgi:EAL and modified HD-GYP domain-containing signal transduction protein
MHTRESSAGVTEATQVGATSASRKILVNRQPIYDQNLAVFAYSLVYQNPEAPLGGYHATSELIYSTFMEMGLEGIVGRKRAVFCLTRGFLLLDYAAVFPTDKVILEVSEVTPSDTELIKVVRDLSAQGYTIALNDMVIAEYPLPLLEAAGLIIIDLRACPTAQLQERRDSFRQYAVKLVARHVDTQEAFAYCQDLGFDYFQGYFFCQPETIKHQRSLTNRMAVLQLMAKLLHPDTSMNELEAIVSRDVSLSYKLLRLINSSFYSLRSKVTSLRQALLLLGTKALTTWVSLILLSGIDDKPHELTTTAMVRAKMCELLASQVDSKRKDTFFLMGLLSVMDALMDMCMPEIVASLPLDNELAEALLYQEGTLGLALRSVLAYEHGNWDDVYHLGLDSSTLTDAYLQAVVWAEANLEVL